MKSYETVAGELTELLTGAGEILSADMTHIAVRRRDRVSVLRYTPFGGHRETTAADYIQDMDALGEVYAQGSMTLRRDGTARAYGNDDVYGQLQIADGSLWRQAVKIVAAQPKILGLLPDGTAIAYGYGRYGQTSVFHWRDLADISAGPECAVGKLASGETVGTSEWKERPVEDWDRGTVSFEEAFAWREGRDPWLYPKKSAYPGGDPHPGDLPEDLRWSDLSELVPEEGFTVGVRRDGTLVGTGNDLLYVISGKGPYLPDWRDIRRLRILHMDRFRDNFLFAGITRAGQVRTCAPWEKDGGLSRLFPELIALSAPVVQVLGGKMDQRRYMALLDRDGRVALLGELCPALNEMADWRGIRALTLLKGMEDGWPEWEWEQEAGVILGLSSDGTVRAVHRQTGKLADLYRYVCREVSRWTDVTHLCGGGDPYPRNGSFAVAGLREDGTVAFCGCHSVAPQDREEPIPDSSILPEERLRQEVSQWRNIRKIWYVMGHVVGQDSDGRFLLSKEKSF